MRSLPWLKKTDGQSAKHTDALEGDRNTVKEKEKPETAEVESSEQLNGSETESEEDAFKSGDNAIDIMIPGYDHDDAYIMVEHDLLEAAKQVTRHIHLAAYQKHAAVPMPNIQDIKRPTTGPPKSKPQVDGISDDEEETYRKDLTTLGQLLRRRPPPKTVAVTPLKRKERSPAPMNRTSNAVNENKPISKNGNSGTAISREDTRGDERDDEDNDEDDEDLARPFKKVWPHGYSLTHMQMAKIASMTSASSIKSTKPHDNPTKDTIKSSTVKSTSPFDPDWIFSGLWKDDLPVTKRLIKREKVSLAAQLEESSLKIFEKKKPISLKDQFKFLDS